MTAPSLPSLSRFVRWSPAGLLLLLALSCGTAARPCIPSQDRLACRGDGGTDGGTNDAGEAGATAAFDAWLAPRVAPLLDVAGAPGKATAVVVAVSSPGLRHAFAYGVTRVGGPPTDGQTVFELGSLTKVYTGLLLGLSVEDGRLALGDLINPWFPAGAPSRNGTSISLLDLATHHSGLPNYDPGYASGVPMSPGAHYSEADLAACMAGGCPLQSVPGTRALYSNLGSGTLGYILSKRSGKDSYEALLRQEILAPLQLDDTSIQLSAGQQARLAQGYSDGSPAPSLKVGEPLVGAGALRATALDVLRFLESSSGSPPPPLPSAWQRVLEPRRATGMTGTMIGLQVAVENVGGTTVYSKSGTTPGFSSHVFFSSSPQAVVVVLSNAHELDTRSLGLAAWEQLTAPP